MKQTRYWSLEAKLAYYTDHGRVDECWRWRGARFRSGYGLLMLNGRNQSAHRLAWESARGATPTGLQVLHRCDVRSCVNPEHLFLGTNAENVADKTAKGRARKAQWRGENSPLAKLTQAEADAIRAASGRQRDIAAAFGVRQRLVGNIKRGECWVKEPVLAAMLMRGR